MRIFLSRSSSTVGLWLSCRFEVGVEKDIRTSLFPCRVLLGDLFYYNRHYDNERVQTFPVPLFSSTFHRIATWEITSCYSTLNIIPPCCWSSPLLLGKQLWLETPIPGWGWSPLAEMICNARKSPSAPMSQEETKTTTQVQNYLHRLYAPRPEKSQAKAPSGSCPELCAKGDKQVSLPFWHSADLSLPPEKAGRVMMTIAHWTFHCMLQLNFVPQPIWLLTVYTAYYKPRKKLQGWIVSCQESIFIVPKHFFQIPQQNRQPQSKLSSQIRNSSVLVVHVSYSQLHG